MLEPIKKAQGLWPLWPFIVALIAVLAVLANSALLIRNFFKYTGNAGNQVTVYRLSSDLEHTAELSGTYAMDYVMSGNSTGGNLTALSNDLAMFSTFSNMVATLPLRTEESVLLAEIGQDFYDIISINVEAVFCADGIFKDDFGLYTITNAPNIAYARELVGNPAQRTNLGLALGKLSVFQSRFSERIGAENATLRKRINFGIVLNLILVFLLIIDFVAAMIINRKKTKEYQNLLERLYQSQRMESIGKLAGGVAHDFNNMLTAIKGYSEILLMESPETPVGNLHDEIGEIKNAALRSADLTAQLLSFSRKQLIKPSRLDLGREIRLSQRFFERTLGENVKVVCDFDDSIYEITADSGQIHQLLLNFMNNARDFMPQGGSITLSLTLEKIKTPTDTKPDSVLPGDYVALSIRDTGPGIGKGVLPHIFEPFFSTKDTGQGSGLGLAVAYGIVHQHGGFIRVESDEHGTNFTLYFPHAIDPVVSHEQGDAPIFSQYGEEGEQLLLVEDEETVLKVTASILQKAGYRVITATNVKEAQKIYHRKKSDIALCILDVMLPDGNGKDLGNDFRQQTPEQKIIYYSGYTEHNLSSEDITAPNTAFLQKPYSYHDLLETVQLLIKK